MYKKLNYATGVLSAGISSSSTEVVLKAGHTITTETGEANKFVGVFFDKAKSSPFQDVNREIVEAYRTDTNKFTIARAKEGTSAKSWVEDDNFMLIASSAVFDEYEAELNNKQDALGFTPENITNKKTTITDSDTDYLTSRAVKTAVDAKEPILTKGNLSGSGVITIDNTRQVIGGAATISHTDSATVRHVTDTEKATWNAKQDALGFTAENVANKKTTITDSDIDYPTGKAVKTAVDAKAPLDSPTFATSITGSYLTASEILITDANKKIISAPVATYPSLTELSYVKGLSSAVQDQIDAKAPIASPTFTGTVGLPKAVNVKDTSADHEYKLAVSELTADRTITLPLLTGNDTFMFKDFHKASSSEINTGTEDNKYITPLGLKNSHLLKWRIGGNHSGDVVPELVGNTIISEYNIFATGNIVIKPPSVPGGDYEAGMKLLLNIESISNWNITWDTIYESNGLVLPRKCNSSVMYLTFIYQNNKWRLLSADPYVLASGLKGQKTVETSDDMGNDLIPLGYYKENELYVTALNKSSNIKPPYSPIEYPALNGNTLLIRIKDNGTERALTWNSIYRAIGVELPTTTTAGKTLYIGCKYNSADSKWDVLAVGEEA